MAIFSNASKRRITTLHPDLQEILNTAIKFVDFSVLDGLRNETDQTIAVINKRSNAKYPLSKHNRSKCVDGSYNYEKSDAFDIAPYPIKWPDIQNQTTKEYIKRTGAFYRLAGTIIAVAHMQGIAIKWGGDFKNFFDGPHFERVAE